MNTVLIEQIKYLSETKTRFQKIKDKVSNWKGVCIFAVTALTLKVASEQLIMMILRHQ